MPKPLIRSMSRDSGGPKIILTSNAAVIHTNTVKSRRFHCEPRGDVRHRKQQIQGSGYGLAEEVGSMTTGKPPLDIQWKGDEWSRVTVILGAIGKKRTNNHTRGAGQST